MLKREVSSSACEASSKCFEMLLMVVNGVNLLNKSQPHVQEVVMEELIAGALLFSQKQLELGDDN